VVLTEDAWSTIIAIVLGERIFVIAISTLRRNAEGNRQGADSKQHQRSIESAFDRNLVQTIHST
jgi:hypothetical protein